MVVADQVGSTQIEQNQTILVGCAMAEDNCNSVGKRILSKAPDGTVGGSVPSQSGNGMGRASVPSQAAKGTGSSYVPLDASNGTGGGSLPSQASNGTGGGSVVYNVRGDVDNISGNTVHANHSDRVGILDSMNQARAVAQWPRAPLSFFFFFKFLGYRQQPLVKFFGYLR